MAVSFHKGAVTGKAAVTCRTRFCFAYLNDSLGCSKIDWVLR